MTAAIDIAVDCPKWTKAIPDVERRCRRAAEAALAAPIESSAGTGSVAVLLASDAALRALNRRFRGFDKPTNVLSFPAGEGDSLGDLALAYDTAATEARADGIALADHLAHLVVHGVLHLRGLDHQRAADAEAMEAVEIELLARLGIADPYRPRDASP